MLPYVRSLFAVFVVGSVAAACGSGDSSQLDFGDTDAATSDGGGNDGRASSGSSGSSSGGSGSSSGESGSGSGSSSGSSGSSSGSSGSSSGGATCGSCTTDSECESSCPPVQGGGTNCCDTGSGVCYATTQSSCPSPVVDSGSGG